MSVRWYTSPDAAAAAEACAHHVTAVLEEALSGQEFATLLVLSRFPAALGWVGEMLGVADPAAALLMVAGCIFGVVLFRLSLRISGLKDSNIALAQRVAILEYRLEALDEKVKAPSAG